MPSKQKHLHNSVEYPSYKQPSNATLKNEIKEFRILFGEFCNAFGFKQSDFSVDETLLIRSLIRVDQRKLHYKMYHKGTMINELKEVALLCYWINHYKPISQIQSSFTTVDTFNEMYSIYLMLSTIQEYRSMKGLTGLVINNKTFSDLKYTLIHRNTSYDSMVLLVEALAAA